MKGWIKTDMELHDKPEVIQISGCLEMERDTVVGKLLRIWAWFDKHTIDGHAKGVTGIFLDELVGHKGFADALLKVDWLEVRSGSLSVPHFDRHNGKSAKKRAESSERQRKSRETRDKCHRKSVTDTRPEKRREEKSTHTLSRELEVEKIQKFADAEFPNIANRKSYAIEFHGIFSLSDWFTQGASRIDLLSGQKWKHRFKSFVESEERKGAGRNGGGSNNNPKADRTAKSKFGI